MVNFSKMVMKLWDGGDKDPCDNQIFLLVCISETNLSPKCKSSISDFWTVNKDVEKLAVGQCEQSDPRGGGEGRVKPQNQVLTYGKV